MRKICIGIPVQSERERLRATIDSVRQTTPERIELVVLPDNADEATKQFIARLDVPIVPAGSATGGAACFNRLAQYSDAGVIILLESGARVGPRWLDHLLRGLDADPRNGLAGPSTNISWNEQCAFRQTGARDADVAHVAIEAAKTFKDQLRTLEPLYSLSDFCYVVRREVIEAVGAADETYSTGPCWEMDYNIRAARAGWRGVWVGAAYVHRASFTARRRIEEAGRFEASKRLYQNKFCGARLRGEKTTYREHCRGDACQNFAPADLIEIKRPLSTLAPAAVVLPPAKSLAVVSEPLVTCIMPTYNRRSYIPQAIRCFLRQDYPNLELVVVDDGTDPVLDLVPPSDRVRYVRFDQKLTIGAKRNLACENAHGEFIVHWDDDDWYPSWRVRAQVSAMIERGSDLSGSSRVSYYDPALDQAWEYRYPSSKAPWVAGNTLAYRKSLWGRKKFPDIQVGEDSRFVWSSNGRAICDLADPALCVGTVHSENTSRKNVRGVYWHSQSRDYIDSLLGDDVYFYRTPNDAPLVSCIMPTYERRNYVPQAIQSFLQQDYPNRELIVIDDGKDAIRDLVEGMENVRYFHVARMSIGAKRNFACKQAQGEIIAHWDDDDWYSPDRLRYQVAPILTGKADLTGLENAFVLELPRGEFWTIDSGLHKKLFVGNVHGGTLVFRKELWTEGLQYPAINLAEDAWLLNRATRLGKRLVRLSNPGVFVYVRHGRNAWRQFAPGQFIDPKGWQRISPPLNFPASALAFFKNASGEGGMRGQGDREIR